jgi:hypothetical protein
MLKPEGVTVKKIKARLTPFFYFKKGCYWFDEPVEDVGSLNKFHLYIEGFNQPITKTERNKEKIHDILKEIVIPPQIKTHRIWIPKNIKAHIHKHYIIIISPDGKLLEIQPTDKRQPLSLGIWHTLGVYQQKEIRVPNEDSEIGTSSKSQLQLVQLTTQVVVEQVKFASQVRNFSSHYTYLLSKKIQRIEKYWISWVSGSIDPKVMIALITMIGLGAAIFLIMYVFGNPKAMLGPMPTG